MARRNKKLRSKGNSKSSYKNEIYGIVLVALSFLIGLSIYIKPSGIAGMFFREFFLGLLGIGAYLFPIFVFLIGSALVINKGVIKISQRFMSIVGIIYDLMLLINNTFSYSNINRGLIDRLEESFKLGLNSRGGGIISELVNIPLLYIFGRIGSYIVLVCAGLILVVLALEVSIGEIANLVLGRLKDLKINKKQRKILIDDSNPVINNSVEAAAEEDRKMYEENIEKIDRKIKVLDYLKLEQSNKDNDKDKDKQYNKKKETESDDIEDEIIKNRNESRNIEYVYPDINLLNENKNISNSQDKKDLLNNARILEDTLQSFSVDAKVVQVSRGPSVTRYELHPSPGVKVSRIVNLADDIALNLAAPSVRIEAPIPGKAAVGIEVPNKEVVPVTLREVLESNEFMEFNSKLAFALGKDIGGRCIVTDLSKMPHLLIAGATGSGKSVCINTLIISLIYKASPAEVRLLMIDPKVVELSVYNGIPHLLIPVVTDPKKAASALYWAVNEMTQRYKLFADNNVRNIESYNSLMESKDPEKRLPQIVIIIDELADLMMVAPNDVEDAVCRLAQMARAAGMHLVIATQRPSVDVITGVIKANIPSRISFAVSSQIDSRTILDMSGAEKLLGKGDMLFMPIGESKPIRIQGAFISEKEVEKVVEFLKQSTSTTYDSEIIEEIENKSDLSEIDRETDELLPEAINIAIDYGQVSASMLQRRLRIGFNRAARLIEEMELRGIVGPQEGSKPRQVIMKKSEIDDSL